MMENTAKARSWDVQLTWSTLILIVRPAPPLQHISMLYSSVLWMLKYIDESLVGQLTTSAPTPPRVPFLWSLDVTPFLLKESLVDLYISTILIAHPTSYIVSFPTWLRPIRSSCLARARLTTWNENLLHSISWMRAFFKGTQKSELTLKRPF